MLGVRISKQCDERLTRLAVKTERSKSYLVKKALDKFLAEEEEKQIAEQAYAEFLQSGQKLHSFAEVMQENGL